MQVITNLLTAKQQKHQKQQILQIHQIHYIHQKMSGVRCCCCSFRHVANWVETWHSKSFTGINAWVIITVNFLRLLILLGRDLGRCLLLLCPPGSFLSFSLLLSLDDCRAGAILLDRLNKGKTKGHQFTYIVCTSVAIMSWQVAKQSFMITSDFNQNGISLFVLVLEVFSSLVLSSMNFTQGLACVKSIQQWQKHQSTSAGFLPVLSLCL